MPQKASFQGVLGMEDSTDGDYNDIVCSISSGRFYDINGTNCKFTVDSPPSSKGTSKGKFN